MEAFIGGIASLNEFVWGIPMIVLLCGTHIFMSIRTGFIQLKLPKAIKLSVAKDPEAEGDISQFGALCTALSGTLGVGCIVGVATAIISGGPGAVFWMWIIGILGMATKYAETFIAIKFRVKDKKNNMLGGAMYVWERAFKKKNNKTPWWAKLGAICFAAFTAIATLGTGCAIQSSAITETLSRYIPVIPQWILAIIVAIITAISIFGGVKGIANICKRLIPFMTISYLLGCIILLFINYSTVFPAIGLIFECAFTPKAAFGAAIGSGIAAAIQFGMARGLFSNESGLGTAPIIASAASTKNPARQSLVAMTGTFWSTVVICAITGIILVSSMIAYPEYIESNSQTLTLEVFELIPIIGGPILCVSLVLFAFSTIIGWSYYANRSVTYLFGNRIATIFMVIYVLAAYIGGAGYGSSVWVISDLTNAFMAIPNVIVCVLLHKIISKETKHYIWNNNLDEESKDAIIQVNR